MKNINLTVNGLPLTLRVGDEDRRVCSICYGTTWGLPARNNPATEKDSAELARCWSITRQSVPV